MEANAERLRHRVEILKALAHPSRLLIVEALAEGERCVCELQQVVGADMSTVSKHLFLLKNARLIVARKAGRWVHYRLNDRADAPYSVTDALAWVAKHIAGDPVIEADRQRLNDFLTVSLEAGCGS